MDLKPKEFTNHGRAAILGLLRCNLESALTDIAYGEGQPYSKQEGPSPHAGANPDPLPSFKTIYTCQCRLIGEDDLEDYNDTVFVTDGCGEARLISMFGTLYLRLYTPSESEVDTGLKGTRSMASNAEINAGTKLESMCLRLCECQFSNGSILLQFPSSELRDEFMREVQSNMPSSESAKENTPPVAAARASMIKMLDLEEAKYTRGSRKAKHMAHGTSKDAVFPPRRTHDEAMDETPEYLHNDVTPLCFYHGMSWPSRFSNDSEKKSQPSLTLPSGQSPQDRQRPR